MRRLYWFWRGLVGPRRPPVDRLAFAGWRVGRRIRRAALGVKWAVADILRPRPVEEVEA